jgi:hypothetical protein
MHTGCHRLIVESNGAIVMADLSIRHQIAPIEETLATLPQGITMQKDLGVHPLRTVVKAYHHQDTIHLVLRLVGPVVTHQKMRRGTIRTIGVLATTVCTHRSDTQDTQNHNGAIHFDHGNTTTKVS